MYIDAGVSMDFRAEYDDAPIVVPIVVVGRPSYTYMRQPYFLAWPGGSPQLPHPVFFPLLHPGGRPSRS